MAVRFGSLNVFGIKGRDVRDSVAVAVQRLPPSDPSVSAVAFEEVWRHAQLAPVLDAYLGAQPSFKQRTNVGFWSARSGPWKCLVPVVPPVIVPILSFIPKLELSSGLALCVQGTVEDAFFTLYRGGQIPDSASNKGFLAALLRTPGQPKRAVVATHLHDYSNDAFGGGRNNHLDVITSCVKWINKHWRVPIVLLGDFNIDSISAFEKTNDLERRLYGRLVRAGLGPKQGYWDVNARSTGLKPKPTNDAGRAIDHHFLIGESAAHAAFSATVAASDHLLTESSW